MKDALAFTLCIALVVSPMVHADAGSTAFEDPLKVAATSSEKPASASMVGIVHAGDRLVAVGPRGHILLSDDQGQQWRQVSVPVSTDLTAIFFASAKQGWAVGHDGVVLHSTDGGESWQLQLDGTRAARIIGDFYATPPMQASQEPEIVAAVREAQSVQQAAPSLSLLGVWFKNEREGFVVGAFNVVLQTQDGGNTWIPWYHRTENPEFFHLYNVSGSGDDVYIVGERGLVMRLDPQAQRFVAVPTPYPGSFFGVLVSPPMVLIYGLRGNAYVSQNQGHDWTRASLNVQSSFLDAVVAPNGHVLLASQRGELFSSADLGRTFNELKIGPPRAVYAMAPLKGDGVALAGASGLWVEPLNTEQHQ